MLYQRLMTRSNFYRSWELALSASPGNTIFYYEFNNNTLDSSGNGYDATITGTITYTNDDPAASGGTSANVTGSTSGQIPVNALTTGNNPFTLIGVVKVPSTGFGNCVLWMGGSDGGSPTNRQAFSMSFFGSAGSPAIGCDFARSTVSYPISTGLIDKWMTVIVEFDSTNLAIYVAPKGGSFSKIGETALTMNTVAGKNWLFAWGGDGSGGGSPIRLFIGACAFVGLKDTALSATDRDRFLIP